MIIPSLNISLTMMQIKHWNNPTHIFHSFHHRTTTGWQVPLILKHQSCNYVRTSKHAQLVLHNTKKRNHFLDLESALLHCRVYIRFSRHYFRGIFSEHGICEACSLMVMSIQDKEDSEEGDAVTRGTAKSSHALCYLTIFLTLTSLFYYYFYLSFPF